MLDWLIIGGGVHGTYLANVIHNHYSHSGNRLALRVLDPEGRPMARWERLTKNAQMEYLRSPRVHHIDLASNSLHLFALNNYKNKNACYAEPYYRPNLELFRQHSQSVILQNNLVNIFIRGRAIQIKELSGGLSISTTLGTIKTRHLLLCIGLSDQPLWPAWARTLKENKGHIYHILDPNTRLENLDIPQSLIIVGGGLTAFQTALASARKNSGKIVIVTRHGQRIHQFDTDPGWIGPKYLSGFHRIQHYNTRRKIINAARNRGSIPADVLEQLNLHIRDGKIEIIQGEVTSCHKKEDGTIQTRMTKISKPIITKMIILATGFHNKRPGGKFIDQAISELNLSIAGCGYPIVDKALRWHNRIFVSGPLSELEIGPVAKNIIGARLAGKRLMSVL